MALRVVFMGTAELACASLRKLASSADFSVISVVTQPDKPKGRDLKLHPPPVKTLALELGLTVDQPDRARNADFIGRLAQLHPDFLVVAAYGQILPQSILDLPKFGAVNVHTSLLPLYRGAAPIQWAILDGQPETGVTIMKMNAGLDTGDILTQSKTPISPDDTAATLHDRLAEMGAELLILTLLDLANDRIKPIPQDETRATYARKIAKTDGRLDWNQTAAVLWNRIRAFVPWPGTFTHLSEGDAMRVLKIFGVTIADASGEPGQILQADKAGLVVACGQGALRISEVQLEGKRRMPVSEWLTGHPIKAGTKLS